MTLHDDSPAPQKLLRAAELMCMKPRVRMTSLLWPSSLQGLAEAHKVINLVGLMADLIHSAI